MRYLMADDFSKCKSEKQKTKKDAARVQKNRTEQNNLLQKF